MNTPKASEDITFGGLGHYPDVPCFLTGNKNPNEKRMGLMCTASSAAAAKRIVKDMFHGLAKMESGRRFTIAIDPEYFPGLLLLQKGVKESDGKVSDGLIQALVQNKEMLLLEPKRVGKPKRNGSNPAPAYS
jgi:hypothetical protein